MEWDRVFKTLSTLNWVILLLLGVASYWLMSETFSMGIILGGLIIIANFHLFQSTIRQSFSSSGVLRGKKAAIVAKYYVRLVVVGILIYFLITRQWVHPVGLVIGLSLVVISIVGLGVHMIWKQSSGKAT